MIRVGLTWRRRMSHAPDERGPSPTSRGRGRRRRPRDAGKLDDRRRDGRPRAAPRDTEGTGRRRGSRRPSRRRFRFPLGVELFEGENYRQREGYEIVYLKDDELPRYQYTIAVSAHRTGEVFRRLASLLAAKVRVVLETPGTDGSDREVCDVWMSRPVTRGAFLRAFSAHERLFVHDGMVGFGAVDPDGARELFLDEHKLLYFYAPDMDGADAVLAELGLPALEVVRHFSELGHVHVSLSAKGRGESYWDAAEELHGRLRLEWEESREYS
jgi:hypothetical protein